MRVPITATQIKPFIYIIISNFGTDTTIHHFNIAHQTRIFPSTTWPDKTIMKASLHSPEEILLVLAARRVSQNVMPPHKLERRYPTNCSQMESYQQQWTHNTPSESEEVNAYRALTIGRPIGSITNKPL